MVLPLSVVVGGGGGVVYNSAYAASGNITVTIGAGGARGQCGNQGDGCTYATGTSGSNGSSSIFGTITSVGGGGGGLGNGGLAVFPVPMAEAVAPILVMVEQELMDILEVRDLIVILPAAPVVEVELEVLE